MEEELCEAKADTERQWKKACEAAAEHAQVLRSCGLQGGTTDLASLPRLNALAQDSLASLRSLIRQFELLAHQSSSDEGKDACLERLELWKEEYQSLHAIIRSANLQAKANIQKAAKSERDLLLGGGEESTNLRRNLQTRAGMSAAAESVTESLRRTRQMMVQELERGSNTLVALDESNKTLRKADAEYKGQRFLLNIARSLLSILKRQDILDRIILVVGFLVFSAVVTYIFNQRIGLFKAHRTVQERAVPEPFVNLKQHINVPSVSIDIPPDTGTNNMQRHDHPLEMEMISPVHQKPKACEPHVGNCPEVDPPNSLSTGHAEL